MERQYELSIWEDYIVPKGANHEEYYEERKVAIIGSHQMEAPERASNIELREAINGERTLTFEILRRIKGADGELVDNPYLSLLQSETKLKFRDGAEYPFGSTATEMDLEDVNERWTDFIIKDINENSDSDTCSYIAQEAYINELGKNGWSTVLDIELGNNYGTIGELADRVLEGSGWTVGGASVKPVETSEQPLFKAVTSSVMVVTNLMSGDTKTLPVGSPIYLFYDDLELSGSTWTIKADVANPQFLWKGGTQVFTVDDIDEKRVVVDELLDYNFIGPGDLRSKIGGINPSYGDLTTGAILGKRIVESQTGTYDTDLGFYVREYKVTNSSAGVSVGSPVFGYEDVKVVSPTVVNNVLTNSFNPVSNVGWLSKGSNAMLSAESLPQPDGMDPLAWASSDLTNYMKLSQSSSGTNQYYNEGPANARMSLVKDKKYVIRARARSIAKNATNYGTGGSRIKTSALPSVSATLGVYSLSTEVFTAKSDVANIGAIPNGNINTSTDTSLRGYGIHKTRVRAAGTAADRTARVDDRGYVYAYITANATTDSAIERVYLQLSVAASTTHDYYIEDIEVFEYVEDPTTKLPVWPGELNASVTSEKKFYYKNPANKIVYLSPNANYYQPISRDGFESVRHIDIKESNYFNNIQSLAELFGVWVKFKVYHKRSGALLLNSDKTPKKEVIFSRYSPGGQLNGAGFKAGINIGSIQRSITSANMATKVIVKDNTNQYAIDGMASIRRADANPSQDNEIYNFDYFINQGILDSTQVLKDLYGLSSNDAPLLPTLRQLYTQYSAASQVVVGLKTSLDVAKSMKEFYETSIESLNEEKRMETFFFNSYAPTDTKNRNAKKQNLVFIEAALQANRKKLTAYSAQITYLEGQIKTQEAIKKARLDDVRAAKSKFFKKYSRYTQEGTWIDESYIDDNLYYIDAKKVSASNAFPRIDYEVDVVDVSTIAGYEVYSFEIGDRTFIEDPEFFGYHHLYFAETGDVKTPVKKEAIISERTRNFDDPSQDVILVRTFKNQFEELFSKMAATTTQLQYNEGEYRLGSKQFTPTGELKASSLEKTFQNNAFILASATNQSVKWDSGTGIEVTNRNNTNYQVRIVGDGIFLTQDGGRTWSQGITGAGINTRFLMAGQIDAEKINIMTNGSYSFRWDGGGISAFRDDGGSYNVNSYVRFNQYGLYGTDIGQALDGMLDGASFDQAIEILQDEANWSLTWAGLNLKSQNGAVSLTPTGGLEVFGPDWKFPQSTLTSYGPTYDPMGVKYTTDDLIPLLSLGRYSTGFGQYLYGLAMRNKDGHLTLQTDNNGNLALSNSLEVGTSLPITDGGNTYYRFLKIDGRRPEDSQVAASELKEIPILHAGSISPLQAPFKIFGDGRIEATSGQIASWNIGKNELSSGSGNTRISIKSGDDARITIGAGNWHSSDTPFYVDKNGRFSLGSKLDYVNQELTLSGNLVASSFRTAPNTGDGSTAGVILDAASARFYNSTSDIPVTSISTSTGRLSGTDVNLSGTISSDVFESGVRGWQINNSGNAEFENLTARGSLKSTVFVYDEINAQGGSLIIAASGSTHTALNITPTIGSSLILPISRQYPGQPAVFKVNDTLRVKTHIGDGTLANLWLKIVSLDTTNSEFISYTTTVLTNTWPVTTYMLPSATAVVNYGVKNGGHILLAADDSGLGQSPYIDVITNEGDSIHDGAQRVRVRLGNLGGITNVPQFGGSLSGYGLYAENAYLTGTLSLPGAGMSNHTTAGNDVRLWAGDNYSKVLSAPDEVPFKVYEDGRVSIGTGSAPAFLFDPTTNRLELGKGVVIDFDSVPNYEVRVLTKDQSEPKLSDSTATLVVEVKVFKNGLDITNTIGPSQLAWRINDVLTTSTDPTNKTLTLNAALVGEAASVTCELVSI